MSNDLQKELDWCKTLRRIHEHDSVELEELYRHFVFPELPRRPGREALLSSLIGTSVSEAIYVLNSLHLALKVPGAICEFGVAQGATSQLIAAEIISTDRQFYLFDSFEGLPKPSKEDKLIHDIFQLGSMDRYEGTMKSPESEVLGRLEEIKFPRARTHVMKGWVEETLQLDRAPKQVAFAYVDFDFYRPILVTLEYLKERMPKGGRVIVDDYGFFSEGAQKAVDEFQTANPGSFKMSLPLPFAGHFAVLEKC